MRNNSLVTNITIIIIITIVTIITDDGNNDNGNTNNNNVVKKKETLQFEARIATVATSYKADDMIAATLDFKKWHQL